MFSDVTTWKGALPVRHWNTMVPRDQRSALASYCSDMITSGAMYIGDPHSVAAITPSCRNRANPVECKYFKIILHKCFSNGTYLSTMHGGIILTFRF